MTKIPVELVQHHFYHKEQKKCCFFSFIFSIVKYLKGDYRQLLLNDIYRYKKDEAEFGIYLGFHPLSDWETMLTRMGLDLEKSRYCFQIIDEIKNSVQCGIPVILGTDPYYLPFFQQAQGRKHFPNFIMITGFDEVKHRIILYSLSKRDGISYKEYKIDEETLYQAYQGFLFNYHAFYKTHDKQGSFSMYRMHTVSERPVLLGQCVMEYEMALKKQLASMEEGIALFKQHRMQILKQELPQNVWETYFEDVNISIASTQILTYVYETLLCHNELAEIYREIQTQWEVVRFQLQRSQIQKWKNEHAFRESLARRLKNLESLETSALKQLALL